MDAATDGNRHSTVWADAHNHLHDARLDPFRDRWPECIVNATSESDWDAVIAVCKPSHRHAALGIHPWYAHTATTGWDERLLAALQEHPEASIGECGLDSKSKNCPIEIQLPVFLKQLDTARELDRPISIHCVGAWGTLINALRESPPPSRWLMHGFNGSNETARQLASMGAYFSISTRATTPSGAKILNTFRKIPKDRILLETDAPNLPSNVASAGIDIAKHLGIEPEAFAKMTHDNFTRFLSPR